MSVYHFLGSSLLSFHYQGKDYILHGKGPYNLPEASTMVQALLKKKLLVSLPAKKTRTKKIK